jgi:hypothetical protein
MATAGLVLIINRDAFSSTRMQPFKDLNAGAAFSFFAFV